MRIFPVIAHMKDCIVSKFLPSIMADINDFTREVECIYKDERYAVRDNGAVFRYPRDGKRPRKYDNFWTFGKPNIVHGYMEIASVRVHAIVATASSAPKPTKEHVVDHIDTHRRITEWRISVGLRGWKIYSTTPLRGRESYYAAVALKRFWQIPPCCEKMNCHPISDG